MVRTIICYALFAYWIVLLIRVFSTWFPRPPSGPIRMVLDVIYDLTEPVLRLFRNILPPVRMGGFGLDLSPIILFIVIGILQRGICR